MRNLYNFVDFYQSHPDIFHAMSGESEFTDILQSLTAKSPIRLTWSHYAIILQESSKEARDWYEQEAAREMWGGTSPLFEIPSLEKTQIKFGFSPAYSYLCNCILENL